MGEEKPDTLDFVKDFQEYLSQQTQHVNMISGSVSGVKESDELPAGNIYMFTAPLCVFSSLVTFDHVYTSGTTEDRCISYNDLMSHT